MIEAIEFKPGRVEITQSGETHILHELVYFDLNLEVGQAIDLGPAVFKSQVQFAFERGANYLMSRVRSSGQVRDYLLKRDYAPEVAEQAIQRLVEHGLIDDAAFAQMYIESFHGERGQRWLRQKLYQRGIRDVDLPDEDPEIVREILEKRWGNSGINEIKTRQKAQNFLLGRGFSYDTIRKAL